MSEGAPIAGLYDLANHYILQQKLVASNVSGLQQYASLTEVIRSLVSETLIGATEFQIGPVALEMVGRIRGCQLIRLDQGKIAGAVTVRLASSTGVNRRNDLLKCLRNRTAGRWPLRDILFSLSSGAWLHQLTRNVLPEYFDPGSLDNEVVEAADNVVQWWQHCFQNELSVFGPLSQVGTLLPQISDNSHLVDTHQLLNQWLGSPHSWPENLSNTVRDLVPQAVIHGGLNILSQLAEECYRSNNWLQSSWNIP